MIIVDATDWLSEEGDLPADAPPELYRNALRMAQCIEYGGPLPGDSGVLTLIACRRRPDGVACRGTLMVVKTKDDSIYVFCPRCEAEEMLISNWQSSLFADGPPEPIVMKPAPDPESERVAAELPASVTESSRPRCAASAAV